jgi:glutathione S-transferase
VDFAKNIDGRAAGWTLPLPPLTAESSPEPYFLSTAATEGDSASGSAADAADAAPLGIDEEGARHEAAFKLSANRAGVCRFALRGAGQRGARRMQAPLADPYATPNEALTAEMDLVLRAVADLLVNGDGSGKDAAAVQAAEDLKKHVGGNSNAAAPALRACIAYLRDRVGCPRDMSFPAARQFRAHLNWAYAVLG